MADKGIIFSAPMVRALLAGTKTQTRRLLKIGSHFPDSCVLNAGTAILRNTHTGMRQDIRLPYAPGDRLYVRESWSCHWSTDNQKPSAIDPDLWSVRYLADDHIRPAKRDGSLALLEQCKLGRPSIFMPRWASRLWLNVTEVRVQRLQKITAADAIAEGLAWVAPGMWSVAPSIPIIGHDSRKVYSELWDSLYTKPGDTWADNPWIVAVTFTVNKGNIDA